MLFITGTNCAEMNVKIGEESLSIHYPKGFVNACAQSTEIRQVFASSVPPAQRLVACFLEKKEFEIFPEVDPSADNPYLMIQEIKFLSEKHLSKSDFKDIRDSFMKQQEMLFANLPDEVKAVMQTSSKKLSELFSEKIDLSIAEAIPLGEFSLTDNNFAFGLIRNSKIKTEEGETIVSEIIVSNAVLVRGKMLVLLAAKSKTNDKDFDLLKNLILNWGRDLLVKEHETG